MAKRLARIFGSQQFGLTLVILALCVALTLFSGSHPDRVTGHPVNNFLNSDLLIQIATETSFFAIMAAGATLVIVSGGIDLSVGSTYALVAVLTSMLLRANHLEGPAAIVVGLIFALALGSFAGWLNGLMVSRLGVHPFVITLGAMWIYRGIAFVASKAESILAPQSLTAVAKANLGLPGGLQPVPLVLMVLIATAMAIYLTRTIYGRRILAVGGNAQASAYSGIAVGRVLVGVYTICGATAALAALLGTSYYGSASSADASGYELYVIASAVVGGVSLLGGKGSPIGAMLGALLIVLIRQSIRLLGFDSNYEWIIVGAAIIVAVVLDQASTRLSAKRLAEKS